MAIRASNIPLTVTAIAATLLPAHGQAVAPSFAVPNNIALQTGDTWELNGFTCDGLGGQRERQSIVGFSQTPSAWMASLYQ